METQEQSDLAKLMQFATRHTDDKKHEGIDEISPFSLSIQTFSRLVEPDIEINQAFVDIVWRIANELIYYGDIQFALTRLIALTSRAASKNASIAFFIHATKKEDLLIHFRELSTKYRRKVRLQIVVASGNPVIDVKMLYTMVSRYAIGESVRNHPTVLLHDFPRPVS